MSSRYSLTGKEYNFEIAGVRLQFAGLKPRFNVAPAQSMPVIMSDQGRPVERQMRWGLIPASAKTIPGTRDPHVVSPLYNLRRESLAGSPAWVKLFTHQRCLVPADGFFEFELLGPVKQPWRFVMKDNEPFMFAALWERWVCPPAPGKDAGKAKPARKKKEEPEEPPSPDRIVDSFAIVTTTPNELVAKIHDRMPAILSPAHYHVWLNSGDSEYLMHFPLEPFPAVHMDGYRVNPIVNNPETDTPACIQPMV